MTKDNLDVTEAIEREQCGWCGQDLPLSDEQEIERAAMQSAREPKPASPPTGDVVEAWQPRIGEQVVVSGEKDWAADWVDAAGNPMVVWVAAVEAMPGGGFNVTVSEEWPLPTPRPFSGNSLTDGFIVERSGDADDLRPLATLRASEPSRELVERVRGLIERLAPEEPMNQDEQGGCVWCGGSSNMWRRKNGDSYAGTDPRDHIASCPWVEARAALAQGQSR